MSDSNQAYSLLLFLIGQNLRAGIVGKATIYAHVARIIRPEDPRAYEALSYCQLLSGEPDKSLETLQQFEKIETEAQEQSAGDAKKPVKKPKTYNMYFVEIHAYISQGNLEDAKKLMPQMLQAAKGRKVRPVQGGVY